MGHVFKVRVVLAMLGAAIAGVSAPPASAATSVASATTEKVNSSKEWDKVLQRYLKIQSALAADAMEGVKAEAKGLEKAANELKSKKEKADILRAAKELSQAKDLAAAREAFKKLSEPVVVWAKQGKPSGVEVVHCPMAKGSWVQSAGEIRNPYYGKEMLACGEKV